MSNQKPPILNREDLIRLFITDKIVSGLTDMTKDIKDILTNFLGLGTYLKKLTEKDDPLAYIPAMLVVGGFIYFLSVRWGDETVGFKTMIIIAFLITLLIVFRFIETMSKARKN